MTQTDHRKAVGAQLRMVIDALGLTYVQAAEDMGVTKNHLGNWMRGDSYPLIFSLYQFCRRRGVTLDWILLGDPSGLPSRVADKLAAALAPEALSEPEPPADEKPARRRRVLA